MRKVEDKNFEKIYNKIVKIISCLILVKNWQKAFLDFYTITKKIENGFKIIEHKGKMDIIKDDKCIRISKKHEIYYIYDISKAFDFYFSGVEPEKCKKYNLVDFSETKLHKVIGYDLHKIMLPSFTEPIGVVKQYINYAELDEDAVVLDLGAYSGLTAILFDMDISKNNKKASGRVIAVDADIKNISSINHNLKSYFNKTGRKIEYLYGAAWKEDGNIEFSSEGHMASHVSDALNLKRGNQINVKSYTLNTIAKMFNLEKIDFIKCDIEGSEKEVFDDITFLKKYKPKIIIEIHDYDGSTVISEKLISILNELNYKHKFVKQNGFNLPILECWWEE